MCRRPMPMTLCIINWNGERDLAATLTAARRSRPPFDEILVIDNASSDRSREIVRECFPEASLLILEQNRGPGTARNVGFAAARHDRILFADNDVALYPDCAHRLASALAERPDAVAAMPRVVYADRPELIQYDGADCHFLGLMATRNVDRVVTAASTATTDMNSVVTACFLVDRKRWRGGEPFDDEFVFNYEDHDFGVRSRIMGHALLAVPEATCLHGGGTPGLAFREGRTRAPLRVYCLIRNRWRIVLQCYAGRTLLLLAPALAFYEVIQLAAVVRQQWLAPYLHAAAWMLRHPHIVWRRRREVQRRRATRDREYLGVGPLPLASGLTTSKLEQRVRGGLDWALTTYWHLVERAL